MWYTLTTFLEDNRTPKSLTPMDYFIQNMDSEDESTTDSSERRLKIVRLIDAYDLHGIGDELEARWTAESNKRMSLRDLADYFNQELLRAVFEEADNRPLDGEIENVYRLLTSDDVSEADRIRAHRRLERAGVDVNRVQMDLVTYQAVRAYLKDHRQAEYTPTSSDRTEAQAESIQRLKGRIETVTESKLDTLCATDEIVLGEYDLIVGISVICEDCGRQFDVAEVLDHGGCNCELPD